MRALARVVIRRRILVLIAWVLAAVAAAAFAVAGLSGQSLFDRVISEGPSVKGEAHEAAALIASGPHDTTELMLLVHGVSPGDPALADELARLGDELTGIPGVESVAEPTAALAAGATPVTHPALAALLAADGQGAMLVVSLHAPGGVLEDPGLTPRVLDSLHAAGERIEARIPGADTAAGGSAAVGRALAHASSEDLKRGELLALPIALVLLVIVFGGLLAASLPLLAAIASICITFGVLFAVTFATDVDSTAVNVVTVVGLGLAIDYGLLVVNRFREELALIAVDEAIERTVATAGRTVLFSGAIFGISSAGLLLIDSTMVRTLALGALSVTIIAILAALTLLPALFSLWAGRLAKPSPLGRVPVIGRGLARLAGPAPAEGVFSKLTRGVQRMPLAVLTVGVALLVLLGVPAASLSVGGSVLDEIPRSSDQHEYMAELRAHFPQAAPPRVSLVSPSSAASEHDEWVALVGALAQVDGVSPALASGDHLISVVDVSAADAVSVTRDARELRPGEAYLVGGADAAMADFVDHIIEAAPWVAGVIVLATFVLMFLMTGSIIVPLKTLVIAVLSLGASIGVLVWGFQWGHLSVLGFDTDRVVAIYPLVIVLTLAFGFALSMDYEMFLLSRIVENRDAGLGNREAIVRGMQSSGRIITSAAVIIAGVFLGFTTGELMPIVQLGVALAVTVLLDATLVRMLIVPAAMTLLGEAQWWLPRPLRRIHRRFALREG